MPRSFRFAFAAASLFVVLGAFVPRVAAQGVQTGTIRGVVKDQQGLSLPGVTVTVSSPALQGVRTAVTERDGTYTLPTLPPGDYTVIYELAAFESVRQMVTLPLGLVVDEDITMGIGGQTATVTVVAAAPAPITAPVVGANFRHKEVESLAMPRTLSGIAELSPGLTNITPNSRQVSINGAFAFDNIFMINGVDVNDNLFGSPQDLFVEDAIQETQVLTSGISAEYGRFTGGVVNAITKSGGNMFAGSFRTNLTNPAWSTETPFEVSRGSTHKDILNKSYEATLGGPVVKDRLWFFSAGRFENLAIAQTFAVTGIANTQTDKNRRGEVKLTATIAPGQTVQGGYVNNHTENVSRPIIPGLTIDPFAVGNAKQPNSYYFTNYRGLLGARLLAEAQYSQRQWAVLDSGGTTTNIVDSPFLANSSAGQYNAQYFDATDPEHRNNRQLTGSVTSFLQGAGRHEVKGGYEWFRSQRTGGGSFSSTNYLFAADYVTTAQGAPVYDATGHLMPIFAPGQALVQIGFPQRGAALNVDTSSVYAQDHWTMSSRLSADLGVRFEHARSEATGGIVGVNANSVMPRLAAAWDVTGSGALVAHVTYGHYAGRYDENQIGQNSNVGNPDDTVGVYVGPSGAGRDFAPGFNPANYQTVQGDFPTANVIMAAGLSAPVAREFTTSLGTTLGRRGWAEGSFVFRRTSNFIEDFIAPANGITHVVRNGADFGTFTNIVYDNSDIAKRQYQAVIFQSRYMLRDRWSINGHYTGMLQDEGNYEGEAVNAPGSVSVIGNYAEAFTAARNYPTGRLQDFQRHKLRVWSVYDLAMGRFGSASISGLWRVQSGRVYSLVANGQPINATQLARLTAYADDRPGSQSIFFGERGSETFKGAGLFDTSINYDIPVLRSLAPWLKLDVFNLFDNQNLISWNTTIRADATSPKDSQGLATGYTKGPLFGTADSNANFPAPLPGVVGGRTFRVAFGVKF
jgi:outer membrane receptor for ferrienterochelin and colicin